MSTDRPSIVFYDGECGFCNRSVHFLLRKDAGKQLVFAPLQGETAAKMLPETLRQTLSTLVYCRRKPDGTLERLIRSEAFLYALIDTGNAWRYPARIALKIPLKIRDSVYNWIARHRHYFAPRKSCPLPAQDMHNRYLP